MMEEQDQKMFALAADGELTPLQIISRALEQQALISNKLKQSTDHKNQIEGRVSNFYNLGEGRT